ncbi:hypothetical protein QQ054_22095 [Oscillatoria amoena NRMC-F 0135]|nr:hypothetical protein [Oscillatoria amoena NRMC-F 0135]
MRSIYLLPFLLLIPSVGFSQVTDTTSIPASVAKSKKDERPFTERISIGGATSFWIQPSRTYVEIAGLLAYRFPKTLTMGPGYRYIYNRNRTYGKNLNTYGPNFFVRAQLTRRIYLWTEYELLNTEYVVQVGGNEIATKSDHVESLFMGAGYIRTFGRKGRGGVSFQVLYNPLYEREISPYYSPVIYRVGYFF